MRWLIFLDWHNDEIGRNMKQDRFSLKVGEYVIHIGGLSEKGIDKEINQDAYKIGICEEKELAYIIVADGLGSCKHSDQGAYKIVEIVENWLLSKLSEYAFLSDNVSNIMTKRIVEEWNVSYGIDEVFDYDTTMHMAVFYKGSLLVGGIGDGMALISFDDKICKDTIDTKNLFSNVTNSMCSLNANELLEYEVIKDSDFNEKAVMILSTDGIADDLIPEKKLTLPSYFEKVINAEGLDALQNELQEWIEDWETESHSDDKTLCYLVIEKEKK